MRGNYATQPIPEQVLEHLVELSRPPDPHVMRVLAMIAVTAFITGGACLMIAMLVV